MKEVLDLRKKGSEAASSKEISGKIHPHQQIIHKPATIIITVFLLLISLAYIYFQKNILTAVFFFLISLILLVFTFKEKRPIAWEITKYGLTIDASFFPYQDLQSFWIEHEPEQIKEISLRSKKWYQGYLKIPLNQENPLKIREMLLEFLPEEKHEDTLIETVSRKLGI